MLKTVLFSILVVLILFFVSRFFGLSEKIVSPLSGPQKTLAVSEDDKLFDKYKEKVRVTDGFVWATGDGTEDLTVNESNYVAVDKGGKVVLARNADTRHAPASLTKLMTVMVTLDFSTPEEIYTVPKEATGLAPTILLLEEGEKLKIEDLTKGALITSANDAAYVMAYGTGKKLGGSYQLFVKLMNEKVKSLGLTNTHFANATGYDNPEQYTTARDMAKLTQYALTHYPEIKKVVALKSASIPHTPEHKVYELPNWNALVGLYPGADGVKIGHTDEAGHNTIVTSTRDGERFMVVLLGAPDMRARDMWAAQVLNSAFSDAGVKPFRVTLGMLQERSRQWGEQLDLGRQESKEAGENVPEKVDVAKTREE